MDVGRYLLFKSKSVNMFDADRFSLIFETVPTGIIGSHFMTSFYLKTHTYSFLESYSTFEVH